MIVLLTVNRDQVFHVSTGDRFTIEVNYGFGNRNYSHVMIENIINQAMVINFFASFLFVDEDGYCLSKHLCGFFGNMDNLPEEIKKAKTVDMLTDIQYNNFIKTCGVNI